MKKYVKPEMFYEQFELSKHIADCAIEYNDANGNKTSGKADECIAYTDPDFFGSTFPVFAKIEICGMEYQDYCATNGGNGINTFRS